MGDINIVGRKIVAVRPMKNLEQIVAGWDRWDNVPTAIVLDDGTVLFASRDEEGNGPGEIFGLTSNAKQFILTN